MPDYLQKLSQAITKSTVKTWTYLIAVNMGARTIFSRGGQIRGPVDESPPVGSRGRTPVGSGSEPPRKIVKMMHK